MVFPVAFVSEHLETLQELDIKYRKVAEDLGFDQYIRADTVQAHPLFIDCLKELVLENCQ
jgi:ferrochelatase